MAVLPRESYTAGEVARLWPPTPQTERVQVAAPSGLELSVPVKNGRCEVWLAEPGEWTYRWSERNEGTIMVVQALPAPPEPKPAATYGGYLAGVD